MVRPPADGRDGEQEGNLTGGVFSLGTSIEYESWKCLKGLGRTERVVKTTFWRMEGIKLSWNFRGFNERSGGSGQGRGLGLEHLDWTRKRWESGGRGNPASIGTALELTEVPYLSRLRYHGSQ